MLHATGLEMHSWQIKFIVYTIAYITVNKDQVQENIIINPYTNNGHMY